MLTKKSLIKIFCLGMIILQLNCMFLKENEARGCDNMRLSAPGWQDDCAAGSTEVTETGEHIGAATKMPAANTTEEQPTATEAAEGTEGTEEAMPKASNATEATTEASNATVAPKETNETTTPTGNATLQQSRTARRQTSAQKRAARKAAREARRKSAASGSDDCGAASAAGAEGNATILKQGAKKAAKSNGKRASLRLGPGAVAEQANNATETQQPAAETNATEETTEATVPAQAPKTQQGGQLEQKLQDLIGSIKETQDVTIRQLDELKNSDLINIVKPSTNGNGAKKESAPATNETEAGMVAPTENATEAGQETEGTTEGTSGAEGTTEEAAATTPAETNDTATNETAEPTLRSGRKTLRSDAESSDAAPQEETSENMQLNRPVSPCKLKRRLSRKARREARRLARKQHSNENCMLQKQWDLIENMKVSAPTISNAISEACTIARAKASENSVAQGLTETKGSETATANGSGSSISVANAVGKTKSITDSRAMKDSNSVGVTQSNTKGVADSTAANGSVSIANAKNNNQNTNELCAADKSNTVGRSSSSSAGTATSNASDKSLASANALDNACSHVKLAAEDNSITVGNAQISSNANATSTAANQSKAQTVSESTGNGSTDLKAKTNSRAVGNQQLTSGADATADAVNGGNALGTAESKTCGFNEGAAENNSTVIVNNKNANTATSNSKSTGTIEAAAGAGNATEETNGAKTNATTAAEEQPATVAPTLQAGRRILREVAAGNASTEEAGTAPQEAAASQEQEGEKEEETSGTFDESADFCAEGESVKNVEDAGFGDICDTEIKAAKESDVDIKAESETEASGESEKSTTLKSSGGADKSESSSACDMSDMSAGSKLRSQRSSCNDMTLGQGIFRGDAHTKNICRHMCERMNLPRVKRAEIKSGNDGLTIFRCLCGTQYTSWFKPNYGVCSANGAEATKKLTTREYGKLRRKASRKSLRQRRTSADETCGAKQENGNGRASLRRGRRSALRSGAESNGNEIECGNASGSLTTRNVQNVDMKPVVDQFIVNNANSIKAQSADYLNKVQDLLAAKTGSGSNGNGVC